MNFITEGYQAEMEDMYFLVRVNRPNSEEVLNQVDIDGNKNEFETLVAKLQQPAQRLIKE